jgi:hypothetical protein
MNKFYSSGVNLHKNNNPEKMCNYIVPQTLGDAIHYTKSHQLPTIDTSRESRGQTNFCALRLNNVHPVDLRAHNFIVKRLTRFTEKDKNDRDFKGSNV